MAPFSPLFLLFFFCCFGAIETATTNNANEQNGDGGSNNNDGQRPMRDLTSNAHYYMPRKDKNGELDDEAIQMWHNAAKGELIRHLDATNFKDIVLTPQNKNGNGILVIFYSHTCPHCIGFAPTLCEFATAMLPNINGHEKVQIALYNCNRPLNAIYCRQVKNYPTLFFFTKSASAIGEGRKVTNFVDVPLPQMQSAFEQLLEGKFDLSNEAGGTLLELDVDSYELTIQNGINAARLLFVVAFLNGDVDLQQWRELAEQVKPWKHLLRVAYVNCALARNKAYPCDTFTPTRPQIFLIRSRMFDAIVDNMDTPPPNAPDGITASDEQNGADATRRKRYAGVAPSTNYNANDSGSNQYDQQNYGPPPEMPKPEYVHIEYRNNNGNGGDGVRMVREQIVHIIFEMHTMDPNDYSFVVPLRNNHFVTPEMPKSASLTHALQFKKRNSGDGKNSRKADDAPSPGNLEKKMAAYLARVNEHELEVAKSNVHGERVSVPKVGKRISNTAAKLFDASGNSPKNGNVGGNVENHQTPGFVHDFHQQVMNQVARTYYTTFNKLYVLFVFEHPNPLGEKTVAGGVQSATAQFASKLILSLSLWHWYLNIVPIQADHQIANGLRMLHANPNMVHVILYRTDKAEPILSKSYDTAADLHAFDNIISATEWMEDDSKRQESRNCDQLLNRCAPLYFAAETDILKATREAIYDEVVTKVEVIEGMERHNLLNFLDLLVKFLPSSTQISASQSEHLVNTQRAKSVFSEMHQFLERNAKVTAQQWTEELERSERRHDNPFPIQAEWRHCKAIWLKNARRFTCGMWTTFHVLTVNAHQQHIRGAVRTKADAIAILHAIRGWVQSFFGCEDCRSHFLEMTGRALPIDEKVKTPEDVVLYLWRAHNRVNDRLAYEEQTQWEKQAQSDPIFQKRQFPPAFICAECNHADPQSILNFLMEYYARIEPVDPQHHFNTPERDMAYNYIFG